MRKNESGFSVIEILIIILILLLVGAGGYWVYSRESKPKHSGENLQSSPTDNNKHVVEESNDAFTLFEGEVAIPDDGTWKVATGGYWSIETGHCGRGIDYDPDCLDHIMLIPKDETSTNPDQFQVNVTVFRVDDSLDGDDKKLQSWTDQNVGNQNEDVKRSSFAVGGHTAYRSEEYYLTDRPEERDTAHLTYAIAFEDKVVVIRSNLFNGDHYSFKTSNNYIPLMPKIDKLVESIRF